MLQVEKTYIPNRIGAFEEIVPIYDTVFGKMVNARELWFALAVKKKFADWIKYSTKGYIGYDYEDTENHPNNPEQYDFFLYEVGATKGRGKSVEYMLTLDMAKEVAMMSRSAKAHEVRKYFIKVENAFKSMLITLQNETLSHQEKIAEALIISNNLLAKKDEEIKKANRNKEYNKKVNVRLRREIKELKSKLENTLLIEDKSNIKTLFEEKEKEIAYLEDLCESLEDQHTRLQSRLNHLLSMKLDGRSILNAFAIVDVNRRQKFAASTQAKETAKVKAYTFRKDAILNAGIIVSNEPGKSFVETINVNDLDKALIAYINALRKLINNDELFNELFENQMKRANEFLEKFKFENENNEIEDEKEIVFQ